MRAVYDLGFSQDPVIGTVRINPGYAVTGRPQYTWRKQSIVVKGNVLPRGKGQPIFLEVARKSGGVWHYKTVDRSTVRAQGAYELSMPVAQQATRTTWFLRVRVPAGTAADAGSSPRLRLLGAAENELAEPSKRRGGIPATGCRL